MWILPLLLAACGGPPAPVATPSPDAVETPPKAESAPAVAATVAPTTGWGAVFWRDGKAYRTGGGDVLLGPEAAATVTAGAQGACGQEVIGAPAHAALALPAGAAIPALSRVPANAAGIVETAAWRLDELLPARDAFAPANSAPDPARQRGVQVASVMKIRRTGAVPVLLASGTRDCHAVVSVLKADASASLTYDAVDKTCDPLSIIEPRDLDGDGQREFAAWSDHRVLLYRLVEGHGTLALTRIGDWSCP